MVEKDDKWFDYWEIFVGTRSSTCIAGRWVGCQKNCVIIGEAIKSFRWIGRTGSIKRCIWARTVIQGFRPNEVVCVTRPVGGVRSHENCWVGCRRRCRCAGAGYRGRCAPLFSAAGKAAPAKPNPGQSSSAATLGFPGAVSSASPLSEASDHRRPGEANRPEAEEVCLNREATSTIAGFEAKTVSGGQVM